MNADAVPSHKEVVEHILKSLRMEVVANLYPMKVLDHYDLTMILMFYRDVFAPNFVHWLVDIADRCTDKLAQGVLADNIACEVRERHPEMLRQFVEQVFAQDPKSRASCEANAAYTMKRFSWRVNTVAALTKKWSSVDGLLVAAGLEHASLEFVPWMRMAGNWFGFSDFTYLDKHGAADIKHADGLSRAVVSEVQALKISPEDLARNQTPKAVLDLLSFVFYDGIK